MKTYQTQSQRAKKNAFPTLVLSTPKPVPPSPNVQRMSNAEGLAEHAKRLEKFRNLGMVQMGPPRQDNGHPIQPKLTIGAPGDKYEQEADRVAKQVVTQIHSPQVLNAPPSAQRQDLPEDELKMKSMLQRQDGSRDAAPNLEQAINQARGSGQPLDKTIRGPMEQAFGANFGEVRVHTDTQSDSLNHSLLSRAFTTKQDIFFKRGEYQPGNRHGQELIAHELTHVVQQNSGTQHSINRAIDLQLINKFKRLLELEEVTIVEVPNNPKITLDTKFQDYPKGNTYNITSIASQSLLDVNYGSGASAMRQDPNSKEFLASKAYDIVDLSGGGGYMHTVNMAMYNEGISNVERAILHEMGHAKQNEEKGANFATTNRIILEYHNVLLHENMFVFLKEGQGQQFRKKYLDAKPSSKSKKKTWDNLIKHATDESNPHAAQNTNLLDDILDILDESPSYEAISSEVKQNLVTEYFNNT